MRFTVTVIFVLLAQQVYAVDSKNTNVLAVGQGISSPSSTSTVNFSSGYTSESPIGTIYQNGIRLTGEYDSHSNGTRAYGAEFGYGNGNVGFAVGHRKPDCDNCDGKTAADVGFVLGGLGVGVRAEKDLVALAFLFNPQGEHRFGLMAESYTNDDPGNNKLTAYGLGYSYVGSNVTLTLDASSRTYNDSTIDDKRIQVTPGIMVRADIVQFTLNDKITLNKDKNNALQDDRDHDVWFGVGLGKDKWHLALYSHYVNEFAFAGSLFF